MNPDLLERKRRYLDTIIRHINDNPQQFLDLDAPSNQPEHSIEVKPSRNPPSSGRFGPAPQPTETERAMNAGLYDGFTFGLGDELGAGWASILAMFDDREMGDVYDAELTRARAEMEYLQQQHPIAFGGGAIVGSLVNPATYTPAGWIGRGAAAAGQTARAVNLASKVAALAKAGAVNGAIYGFNSGEGGIRSRLENAAQDAAYGATIGGAMPIAGRAAVAGGKAAVEGLGQVIGSALNAPTRRVISTIAQTPEQAATLMEMAKLLRRRNVNQPGTSLPDVLATAMDLALNKGKATRDDLTILGDALYKTGFDTTSVLTTTPRMDRIGKVFVGPAYLSKRAGNTLKSADLEKQYRRPAWKEERHANNQTGWQANLERGRKNSKKFYNNLHVNIVGLSPGPGIDP